MELNLLIFIKPELYLVPVSCHLLNDFRVTFSVGSSHSKEWNLPLSGGRPLSLAVTVNPVGQVNHLASVPPPRKMDPFKPC